LFDNLGREVGSNDVLKERCDLGLCCLLLSPLLSFSLGLTLLNDIFRLLLLSGSGIWPEECLEVLDLVAVTVVRSYEVLVHNRV